MSRPNTEDLELLIAAAGSIRKAALELGVDESTVRRWRKADGAAPAPRQRPQGRKAKTTVKGDDATIYSEPSEDVPNLGDLDGLIRSRGLVPEEWEVLTVGINDWQALADGGGGKREPKIVTLHQLKATLKRKVSLTLVSPATHVPKLLKGPKRRKSAAKPALVVVEGDHQYPYHEPGLDAASLEFLKREQPDRHVFLGDTSDFPTISRHADHPAAMADVQETIDGTYHLLRRKVEAAPHAIRHKLEGNHDWRLKSELLARAERLYGIAPAGEDTAALSLKRLLHLEALGIELVEDPRGWEHGEVELVPGRDGLVVRHGFLTGQNTARKTLDKLGRSALVGHVHSKEQIMRLDWPERVLRVLTIIGTMSRVGDEIFPHFAVNPNHHQGFATVTIWPTGKFLVEQAVYQDGKLYWRDRIY